MGRLSSASQNHPVRQVCKYWSGVALWFGFSDVSMANYYSDPNRQDEFLQNTKEGGSIVRLLQGMWLSGPPFSWRLLHLAGTPGETPSVSLLSFICPVSWTLLGCPNMASTTKLAWCSFSPYFLGLDNNFIRRGGIRKWEPIRAMDRVSAAGRVLYSGMLQRAGCLEILQSHLWVPISCCFFFSGWTGAFSFGMLLACTVLTTHTHNCRWLDGLSVEHTGRLWARVR